MPVSYFEFKQISKCGVTLAQLYAMLRFIPLIAMPLPDQPIVVLVQGIVEGAGLRGVNKAVREYILRADHFVGGYDRGGDSRGVDDAQLSGNQLVRQRNQPVATHLLVYNLEQLLFIVSDSAQLEVAYRSS